MEEKKKKTKVEPVTKIDARKKVEELKKNSTASKKETKKIEPEISINLEKENNKKVSTKPQESFFKKTGNSITNMAISFSKLETSMKLCIIIPIIIFLVIIGNRLYSEAGKRTLTCTYTGTSPILGVEQQLDVKFNRDQIYNLTKKVTYTVKNSKWKSISELEKEAKEKIEKVKDIDGVVITYEIKDETLTMTEKYNYYKLSSEELNELNLEENLTLEEYKTRYEEFEYECKSK